MYLVSWVFSKCLGHFLHALQSRRLETSVSVAATARGGPVHTSVPSFMMVTVEGEQSPAHLPHQKASEERALQRGGV